MTIPSLDNPTARPIRDRQLEAATISAILTKPQTVRSLMLPEQAFSDPGLRRMYRLLVTMVEDEAEVDVLLLKQAWFEAGGEPDDFLRIAPELYFPDYGPASWKVLPHYANVLKEIAYRRAARAINAEYSKRTEKTDPADLEDWRKKKLDSVREMFAVEVSDDELAAQFKALLVRGDDEAQQLVTGYPLVDAIVGTLDYGTVLTCIARPSVGKSLFVSNIVVNHLRSRPDYGIVFASLEMPLKLAYRRLARQWFQCTDDKLIEQPEERKSSYHERVTSTVCFFCRAGGTLSGLKRIVQQWEKAKSKKIRVVVIDYLQYLGIEGRGLGLYEKASVLSRGVKEFAKEIDCLVVLLSQVKRPERSSTESIYRCPTMEDARDSGTIEENADSMLGMFRSEKDNSLLCLRALKVREGALTHETVKLRFNWESQSLEQEAQWDTEAPPPQESEGWEEPPWFAK
jgi:replicative DNA helicase